MIFVSTMQKGTQDDVDIMVAWEWMEHEIQKDSLDGIISVSNELD